MDLEFRVAVELLGITREGTDLEFIDWSRGFLVQGCRGAAGSHLQGMDSTPTL